MTNDEINDAVKDFSAYLNANGIEKSIVFVAAVLDTHSIGYHTTIHGFNRTETVGIFSVQVYDRAADTLADTLEDQK